MAYGRLAWRNINDLKVLLKKWEKEMEFAGFSETSNYKGIPFDIGVKIDKKKYRSDLRM